MMSDDIFLYWGSGSVPCWRVQIVLDEKGIAYGSKMISFDVKNSNKDEDILRLNPRGQLPTLKINDGTLNESIGASIYFEDRYKSQGTQLIPENENKKFVLQRAFEALNLQKACNEEIIYYIWRTPDEERDKIYLERKKRELKEEISRWEEYLTNEGFYFKSNRVLCGDEFSLADVFFFPQLAFAVRMGYPIERHPKLNTYYETMSKRESIKKTWPPHWLTSPNATHLSDIE